MFIRYIFMLPTRCSNIRCNITMFTMELKRQRKPNHLRTICDPKVQNLPGPHAKANKVLKLLARVCHGQSKHREGKDSGHLNDQLLARVANTEHATKTR